MNIKYFDEYHFCKNLDSTRFDLCYHYEYSIDQLKNYCDNSPLCMGFNTYGFLKYFIKEQHEFEKLEDRMDFSNDGIYIKKKLNVNEIINNSGIIEDKFIKLNGYTLNKYKFKTNKFDNINELKLYSDDDDKCICFDTYGNFFCFLDSSSIERDLESTLYISNEKYFNYCQIPKNIHFINLGSEFSIINFISIKSSLKNNKGYKIYYHCNSCPENNFLFDKMKKHILINTDFSLLCSFGGIYLSLNSITTKSYDMIIENNKSLLSIESKTIISKPNTKFLKEICELIKSDCQLNELMNAIKNKFDLYCDTVFLPINLETDNISEIYFGIYLNDNLVKKLSSYEYIISNKNKITEFMIKYIDDFSMINKIKTNSDEFIFIPHMDSNDYNINKIKLEDIDKLKDISKNDKYCVGFNTEGYFKYFIDILSPSDNVNGIYIHKERNLHFNKNNFDPRNFIKIKILNNWISNNEMIIHWLKMTKQNNRWNNIILTNDDPDYYVIINHPSNDNEIFDPKKTIIFQMEPMLLNKPVQYGIKSWGKWAYPDKNLFLQVREHKFFHNNLEWHLNKTYSQLMNEHIYKTKIISTIISAKNHDEGHLKRIEFLRYIESINPDFIDIYGRCAEIGFINYKGECPSFDKSCGLNDYKYSFAAENNDEFNYFTEKIVDCILSECLCFYWGCYNLESYFPGAFIRLKLEDFENDYKLIQKSIENNEWEKRLPAIKDAKYKILNEMQMLPTLEKIINAHQGISINLNTFFDKIFVIHNSKNLDRWLSIQNYLNEANITNFEKYESFDVANIDTFVWPSHLDSLNKQSIAYKFNHYEIIRISKSKNYNRILIMEDILILKKDNIMKLNLALQEILEKRINWDILNIHGKDNSYDKQVGHYLYKLKNSSYFCYGIQNICNNFEKMLNLIETNMVLTIDEIFDKKLENFEIYGIKPYLVNSIMTSLNEENKYVYINGTNLKKICINLKRRSDRKNYMLNLFKENNILDCEFYEAIDGKNLIKTNELLNLFRNNDFGYNKNVIGCALSHLNLWQNLLNDNINQAYLIFEDDIRIPDNFNDELNKILNAFNFNYQNWHIIYLGYSSYTKDSQSKDPIHLLQKNICIGGIFGYLINKKGAEILLDFISKNGIKHGIDYLMLKLDQLNQYSIYPHIVFTDFVYSPDCNVDSDIQKTCESLLF
ncbi:Glycosyltransferase family 25 (LPS biosynthesis protein) [uncultured virus]|nr:Glycosyltransferase family 25 (LPS biosynthesis protein) [uncultured virus]